MRRATSKNPAATTASIHPRPASIHRAVPCHFRGRINQSARSLPAHNVSSWPDVHHFVQADAADRAPFPPDVLSAQLFSKPHAHLSHQLERASTGHIQTSDNASAGRHKSRRVCHQSMCRAGQTPASPALFSAASSQVPPTVSHHRPRAIPRRRTARRCNTTRSLGRVGKRSRMVWLRSLAQIIVRGQSRRAKLGLGKLRPVTCSGQRSDTYSGIRGTKC
jgi:hypothetical protein